MPEELADFFYRLRAALEQVEGELVGPGARLAHLGEGEAETVLGARKRLTALADEVFELYLQEIRRPTRRHVLVGKEAV